MDSMQVDELNKKIQEKNISSEYSMLWKLIENERKTNAKKEKKNILKN